MPLAIQTSPSSVRQPAQDQRISKGFGIQSVIRTLNGSPESRAHSVEKSEFRRMPHEPEDARITGDTRSLKRRLLALNVTGSLGGRFSDQHGES